MKKKILTFVILAMSLYVTNGKGKSKSLKGSFSKINTGNIVFKNKSFDECCKKCKADEACSSTSDGGCECWSTEEKKEGSTSSTATRSKTSNGSETGVLQYARGKGSFSKINTGNIVFKTTGSKSKPKTFFPQSTNEHGCCIGTDNSEKVMRECAQFTSEQCKNGEAFGSDGETCYWTDNLEECQPATNEPICKKPYHVLTSDGRCVWSCSPNGTTPDRLTQECICKPGYVEYGHDRFDRRQCKKKERELKAFMLIGGDKDSKTSTSATNTNDATTLKIKTDVLINNNKEINFESFSGRIEGLKLQKLLPNAYGLKPLILDFKMNNMKATRSPSMLPTEPILDVTGSAPTDIKFPNPQKSDYNEIRNTGFTKHGGKGQIDIEISSEYLDAVFGYNYDDHTHKKHENKHAHEYSSTTLPGKIYFNRVKIVNPINKKEHNMEDRLDDGSELMITLEGITVAIEPRTEHISRGVQRIKLAFKHPLIINMHALSVPSKWGDFSKLNFSSKGWLERLPVNWEWVKFKPKRNICLQPVRVMQKRCKFRLPKFLGGFCLWYYAQSYSGRGLAFGKPQADKEWGKVDITFTWRNWHTIVDYTGKYSSVTSGSEETDLKNEYNDDNCVEIYFVEKFVPSDLHGGGACWSGGQSHTKIITSDENVDCGIDKTHLAHELGHVLNLKHPGSGSATRPDGTPGTLMCGSGWENDNPKRQSAENGENASNPLLTTYMSFKPWWGGSNAPDCIDSSDCGTCSAHTVSESCV